MKRFSVLPITLYRLQKSLKPDLRSRYAQIQKNRTSYDFVPGPDNMYNPIEGDIYKRPNGLSLRPLGVTLAQILDSFPARYIFQLQQGLVLPDNLILIHERSDHYSLQTKVPVKASDFCIQVKTILIKQKQITRDELVEKLNSHLEH